MASYAPRVVDEELKALLRDISAIALDGPKGVGKTATALQHATTVHRLDNESERAVADADPSALAGGDPPVLLDEWQRVPELWDVVRRAVDEGASPGRFLLTGSMAPLSTPIHSGAGRIVSLRMRPLSLFERRVGRPTVSLNDLLHQRTVRIAGKTTVTLKDYANEIVSSGFPGIRGLPPRALRAQLDGYLDRIVEHDFAELGRRVRNPAGLRRWMLAYAAATSTTASYEKIRDAATGGENDKPAKTTTIPYRDVLERLWILDPVPAWLPKRTPLARLSFPPRHHMADPALAARLLGVGVDALLAASEPGPPMLRDGPLLGALFESLVTQSVRVYAQRAGATVKHLRTKSGDREVDLIVERDDGRVLAIEVKLARTAGDSDVRHLQWLRKELGKDVLAAVVVTTGSEAYRRKDGVAVVPAALLGP